jgi:hypothetical protein
LPSFDDDPRRQEHVEHLFLARAREHDVAVGALAEIEEDRVALEHGEVVVSLTDLGLREPLFERARRREEVLRLHQHQRPGPGHQSALNA